MAEAARMLRASAGRAALAGGTFLGAHCPPRVTGLVDLSQVHLSYIRGRGKGVVLGAMTTLAAVAAAERCGVLAMCARDCATEPLRQMITVGGNVMMPLRWSDLPLVLHVLGAEYEVYGQGGRLREYTSDEFFKQPPASLLKRGELLREVRVPMVRGVRVARRKLVRNYGDIPAVQVAAALHVSRGMMKNVRVAFVAQRPLPQRLRRCEQLVEGRKPSDELFAEAGDAARRDAGTLTDTRFSSGYVQEILGVFVRRVLEECTNE